ncbi:Uncharacterised protein [Candidatus Burarchaeum australiense]|nr:Uncharacterised protein [Candidatus Burarchaeum australiense]
MVTVDVREGADPRLARWMLALDRGHSSPGPAKTVLIEMADAGEPMAVGPIVKAVLSFKDSNPELSREAAEALALLAMLHDSTPVQKQLRYEAIVPLGSGLCNFQDPKVVEAVATVLEKTRDPLAAEYLVRAAQKKKELETVLSALWEIVGKFDAGFQTRSNLEGIRGRLEKLKAELDGQENEPMRRKVSGLLDRINERLGSAVPCDTASDAGRLAREMTAQQSGDQKLRAVRPRPPMLNAQPQANH